MNIWKFRTAALAVGVTIMLAGCQQKTKTADANAPAIDEQTRIGTLAEVFSTESVQVEGYGIVGGLHGMGSSECPPVIREYLRQYIRARSPEINADELIDSMDTAVVAIRGIMKVTGAAERFDVAVIALPGTQTSSLEGGWLYKSELKAAGGFGVLTKVLATSEGPVFVDTLNGQADKSTGYVLGGGRSGEDYKINMVLKKPDYRVANLIRNRLNERFGPGTAKAFTANHVELKVPAKYKGDKQRFIGAAKAMYLVSSPELTQERVDRYVQKLAALENADESEMILEAIGKNSLGRLSELLKSTNEEVKLRAARCMLDLGSDEGLEALRAMSSDSQSKMRIEALEAITNGAARNDASAAARALLRDVDFNVRLAAYEQLRKLDDVTVKRKLLADTIYLEQISQGGRKAVFVSRKGEQKIVLFGSPILCKENTFVQSEDDSVAIDAPAGQKFVRVMRKHPKRPNMAPLQMESSYDMADVISALCDTPREKFVPGRTGLGVSYSQAIEILKQMCEKGAVGAEFHVGPESEMAANVK